MARSFRQQFLKWIYPLISRNGAAASKAVKRNEAMQPPHRSFYDLSLTLPNGSVLKMADFKGKSVLLVNTASNCGYTDQYAELQQLYTEMKDELIIIGFPANDFKNQEAGNDEEIAAFCQVNYGVSFPLSRKTSVVKGADQHAVYQWLTHKDQNGWNDEDPAWNFGKFLVSPEGILLAYFPHWMKPGREMVGAHSTKTAVL